MTVKTGKYYGDTLFHAIYPDNNPTIIHFMYYPHNKVEATQLLNGLTYILSEDLLINPNNFITISGIDIDTMGIWDKENCTFTDPNELNNEESMEGTFEGTGLTELYLDQDPQAELKKKGNSDEADLQKAYARAQGKYYEKCNHCK